MSQLGPIGWDALSAAVSLWIERSWIIAPAMALSIAAVVLRYRGAREAMARFDARGVGPWIDGRTCVQGTLEVSGPEDSEGRVRLATYTRRKKAADPERLESSVEIRVQLRDGRSLRVPAKTLIKFVLDGKLEIARRTVVGDKGNADSAVNTYAISAIRGASVWLVAQIALPRSDAPLRTSGHLELADVRGVELHFEMARAPESTFGGAYSLLWSSAVVGLLLAFSDGWTVVFMLFEALFAAIAAVSLRNTLRFRRALRQLADAPSESAR